MQPGGQSIVDRLLAAKNTIAGQAVAKVVCKATTEEILGPKKKHLDFLLQATHEINVSIPEVADLLIERSKSSSWVVSFKSLITIHHLMSYGNERFEAYMASHNHQLQSTLYVDRNGMPVNDMFAYIRRYALYLNEKREAYKLTGYDFCKIKRGQDDGFLRTMPVEKLLKALPILQKQLDALLRFDITPNELTNGVINSCFFLLMKDLIYLYAAFNDGVINLLEKYFTMNKKQCREALDIYKTFIDRTDKVSVYLKVAETSGMEHNEIPDLSQAPNSLVEAMENHLIHIEGKKMSSQTLISKQQIEQDIKNFPRDFVITTNDDPDKVLEEEAKALAQFNKKKDAPSPPPPSVPIQKPTITNGNGFNDTDFFSQQTSSNVKETFLTDDIFSLAVPPSTTTTTTTTTTSVSIPISQTVTNPFPTFENIFDAPTPKTNLFNDVLQPISTSTNKPTNINPLVPNNQNIPPVSKPLQSGDLNSSLNQLIENLDIKDYSKIGKDHQWTPIDPKSQQKIGMINGNMNTSGPTWPNSSTINPSFSGINVQSNTMWQQPSSLPSVNNPFAVPNGSSQMNFGGMSNQSMNVNTNPFAAQPFNGNSIYKQQNQQPQEINDPFGNL